MKFLKNLHDNTDLTERAIFLVFGVVVILDVLSRWT